MEKPLVKPQTSFRLRERTAIDVINSMYSYEQVKFFLDLVPALILKNDCRQLTPTELNHLVQVVDLISKLIVSKELSLLLKKIKSQPTVLTQPKRSLKSKVNVHERAEILSNEMLIWANALPVNKRRRIGSVSTMDVFFTSAFFFKEFIKWLQRLHIRDSMTLVELLDAYYKWFPIKPHSNNLG